MSPLVSRFPLAQRPELLECTLGRRQQWATAYLRGLRTAAVGAASDSEQATFEVHIRPLQSDPERTGCYRQNDGSRGAFNVSRRDHVLVVNTDFPEWRQARAVIHEAFHWLEASDGRRIAFHNYSRPVVYGDGSREAELTAQKWMGLR